MENPRQSPARTRPRQGCHKCKAKPAPGTPYIGSPCETCKYAESRLLGHGRGVSYDKMAQLELVSDHGDYEAGIVATVDQFTLQDESAPAVCPHIDNFLSTFAGFLSELSFYDGMQLTIIFGTMRHRSLNDIAKDCGCSLQNVAVRLRRILITNPTLRILLPRVMKRTNVKKPNTMNKKLRP